MEMNSLTRVFVMNVLFITKRSSFLTISLLTMSALLLQACAISQSMIGAPLQDESSEKLEGVWVEHTKADTLYVKQVRSGELRIAEMLWNTDKNKFQADELKAFITKCRDKLFINLELDSYPNPGYFIGYYTFNSDIELKILWISEYAFRKAISEGKVKGEVSEGIFLTESEESLCDFIKDKNIEDYFGFIKKPHDLKPMFLRKTGMIYETIKTLEKE